MIGTELNSTMIGTELNSSISGSRTINNHKERYMYSARSSTPIAVLILCTTLAVLIDHRRIQRSIILGGDIPNREWINLIQRQALASSSEDTWESIKSASKDELAKNNQMRRLVGQNDDALSVIDGTPGSTPSPPHTTRSPADNQAAAAASSLPPPPIHPNISTTSSGATTTEFIDLPASERPLTPLRDHDRDKYTIRILTWKRAPFLAASIEHHSKCPGVEQIQVVWSTLQEQDDNHNNTHSNMIPQEVLNNPKVVVERRDTNQLTNRFDITTPTKTLGILSLDDDVLYPCDVLDAGFFEWTQNPDRLVTYFPRKHVVDKRTGKWKYSYWRGVEYSLALTGTAFIHRDYLYWYTHFLPRPMYRYIQDNMNCEDIAMSLFVSKLTNGLNPLAVDKWCMHSRVQLSLTTRYTGLSQNSGKHLQARSRCLDSFADQLRVKELMGQAYTPGVLVSVANYTIDGNARQEELETNRRQWIQMEEKEIRGMYNEKRKQLETYAISRGLAHLGSG